MVARTMKYHIAFQTLHTNMNDIARICKVSFLVVHHIAFHGLEPFSRQNVTWPHWSYLEVLLLSDSDPKSAWQFPTPSWWWFHRRPCRTRRRPPWTLRSVPRSADLPWRKRLENHETCDDLRVNRHTLSNFKEPNRHTSNTATMSGKYDITYCSIGTSCTLHPIQKVGLCENRAFFNTYLGTLLFFLLKSFHISLASSVPNLIVFHSLPT